MGVPQIIGKENFCMSEKEKATMERFLKLFGKLDDSEKNCILWIADGMALEKELLNGINNSEMAGAAV